MPVASRTVRGVLSSSFSRSSPPSRWCVDGRDAGGRGRAPAHRGPPHGRAQRARGVSRTSPSATSRARPGSSGRGACRSRARCSSRARSSSSTRSRPTAAAPSRFDPAGADPHRSAPRLHRAERVAARDRRLRARDRSGSRAPVRPSTARATLADGTMRTVQLTVQDTAGNVTLSAVTLSRHPCDASVRAPAGSTTPARRSRDRRR